MKVLNRFTVPYAKLSSSELGSTPHNDSEGYVQSIFQYLISDCNKLDMYLGPITWDKQISDSAAQSSYSGVPATSGIRESNVGYYP